MQWMILLAFVGAAAVGYAGFALGDRKRRREAGKAGPRPCRSIGEALELSAGRLGETLVIFLGEDEVSIAIAAQIAEEPRVLRLLQSPKLAHVVLRSDREGAEVLELLFEKYDGAALASLPVGLVLGSDGEKRAGGPLKDDLAMLIEPWLRPAA